MAISTTYTIDTYLASLSDMFLTCHVEFAKISSLDERKDLEATLCARHDLNEALPQKRRSQSKVLDIRHMRMNEAYFGMLFVAEYISK